MCWVGAIGFCFTNVSCSFPYNSDCPTTGMYPDALQMTRTVRQRSQCQSLTCGTFTVLHYCTAGATLRCSLLHEIDAHTCALHWTEPYSTATTVSTLRWAVSCTTVLPRLLSRILQRTDVYYASPPLLPLSTTYRSVTVLLADDSRSCVPLAPSAEGISTASWHSMERYAHI
jgi:hypothetical protein